MIHLVAMLDDRPIGRLWADGDGHPQFAYDDAYRAEPDATPLSLALPLANDRHASDIVEAVLWGVLPDSEHVLRRWAERFHVSARNPLALLAHVGEDCAGAVQFVSAERIDAWLGGDADGVRWLTEREIAERLSHLRRDGGTGREPDDTGQFSLAGAQPKTALYFSPQTQRWGVPSGRVPTSHILKPPAGNYDGYAENEHFCLELARSIGLPSAGSQVLRFGDETAICVERYDRAFVGDTLRRVHQEDFCQALGVFPHRKYQNEGGPSAGDLAGVLRQHSADAATDVPLVFRALAFNWLIAGPDAHAKNYSLLLGGGGQMRLAPLYDVSSAHPYPALNLRKLKLAMKTGGHYRWWEVTPRDWRKTALEFGLDEAEGRTTLDDFAERLPDHASRLARTLRASGLDHDVLGRLVDGVAFAASRWRRFPAGA
ncbi:MAG TPA: type II toxin-antitoxin system HipA family toxin [Tahibacter sp.]|nr:type II toxin-antitoxin system HipA family toxin [Tahibacter sp.]